MSEHETASEEGQVQIVQGLLQRLQHDGKSLTTASSLTTLAQVALCVAINLVPRCQY